MPEIWVRRLFTNIRLDWPYDVRDAYKHRLAEDKYLFSKEFDEVYSDLKYWQICSDPLLKHILEINPLPLENIAIQRLFSSIGGIEQGQQLFSSLQSRFFDSVMPINYIDEINLFDLFSLME